VRAEKEPPDLLYHLSHGQRDRNGSKSKGFRQYFKGMLPGLLYHLSHGQRHPGSKRLSPLSLNAKAAPIPKTERWWGKRAI
jgi:hypothetical protein